MFETGVGLKNPLFFIGVVENNIDQRLEGRVQVRAFAVHGSVQQVPTQYLPWAKLLSGSYDPNVPVPPLNSWVFGVFLDGRDAQQPLILGMIPTQMTEALDPAKTGWGVIPPKDINVLAQGSRPHDYGQPANSRLARGEDIHETYNLMHEVNRKRDIPTNNGKTWDEPVSAYNTQYPYNRVIETAAGHSIELDDTPGAERIMIWHKSGSYLQIDSRGTTSQKSMSDKYDINEENMHVYVGGKSHIYVAGDAYMRVDGNKTEEIMGDLQQIVHQNYMLSVAGQANINASEDVQVRASKIRIESNVGNINLYANKDINVQGNNNINIKVANTLIESSNIFNVKSKDSSIETTNITNIKGDNEIRLGGGSKVSINASLVAIDDIIQLANGDSVAPGSATGAGSAETVELPEPTNKSIGTTSNYSYGATVVPAAYQNPSSMGTSGYASRDDSQTTNSNVGTAATKGQLQPLLDLIANAEGAGYNTVYGGVVLRPPKSLTSMTVQEVRNWQDATISAGSVSNAAGRYQVIGSTLNSAIAAGVVSSTDLYSPENQDKIAIYLLNVRSLNSFLLNNITNVDFGNNLAKEWASFPILSGPNIGSSYYSGIAGNKSRISPSQVLQVLTQVKNYNPSSNTTNTVSA